VVSWYDLKACMRARFVPPPYKKELLLKLQQLHQGPWTVDEYLKDLETTLTKINMHDSEESKITRFMSGLRREIKDVVELYEYSSLKKLVHLAIKVESHILMKTTFKTTHHHGFSTNLQGSIIITFLQQLLLPIFQKKPLLPIKFLKTNLLPLPLSHPLNLQAQNILNV